MTWPLYLAFIAAASVLLVIPGPTVLMVVGYGLAEGRRRNWPLVAGVVLGDAVALTCSVALLGSAVVPALDATRTASAAAEPSRLLATLIGGELWPLAMLLTDWMFMMFLLLLSRRIGATAIPPSRR